MSGVDVLAVLHRILSDHPDAAAAYAAVAELIEALGQCTDALLDLDGSLSVPGDRSRWCSGMAYAAFHRATEVLARVQPEGGAS